MNWEDKIIAYIHGDLPAQEHLKVQEKINEDQDLARIYNDYKILFEKIESEPLENPSDSLQKAFELTLNKYENDKVKRLPTGLNLRIVGIAASMVLLVALGILFGLQYAQNNIINRQHQEIASLQQQISTMLNDQSVSTRVNAIYVAEESATDDPAIQEVLLKTLEKDPSPHVRLAAVEAIGDLQPTLKIKETLINQLIKEEDSSVKIALIHTLTQMKSSEAVHTFDQIIDSEQTPQFLKDEALRAKLNLNKI